MSARNAAADRRPRTVVMLLALACCGALHAAQPDRAEPDRAEPDRAEPHRAEPGTDSTMIFRDVTSRAGVDFKHPYSPEKRYIVESVSGGVALVDYDRDGWLDIYLVNSLTVATARQPKLARSALYRNLGDGTFADVSDTAGVAYPGWGVGACVADYDGDGFQDLYVTGLGRNLLYHNRGDGTFEDVAPKAGVEAGGWSTGCGFADHDRDGDLDLFVSRYLRIDLDALPVFGQGELCKYRDIPVQCGPRGLPGESDLFFRNRGDGSFEEVGAKIGVGDPDKMFGLGVAWLDVDGDGWPDLFVANDTTPNFLYMNKKDGTFEEMSYLLGVAVSEDGKEQGSMGIAVGDYRNEGWPSLFVTNFSEEYNAFYRNAGGDYFTDASFQTKTAAPSVRQVGWGTGFLDVDNDGWLDLMWVNGHVYPQIDQIDLEASAPYQQRRMLFRNRRDGTFEQVHTPGPLAEKRVSRGLAIGDLDNDGRLDVVINDLDGKAQVLRNETENAGHWLLVKLVGGGRMTEAIGATVTVRAGETSQTRVVRSGTSYLSQDDMRQHFGLGPLTEVEVVEVRWPDGSRSKKTGVAVDQVLTLHQPRR